MNLDVIGNLPPYQKAVASFLVLLIIGAAFYYFFVFPKKNSILVMEREISKLQNEININNTKARKLDQLKKENKILEHELTLKQEQLPSEAEVESLLKQVSDLGLAVGLDFKLWKPAPKRESPSQLYLEIPVDVEITGDYHTMATFFDRVGRLPRIVNIENIQVSNPETEKDRVILQTRFVATAFASLPPGQEETEKDEKKK